MVFSLGNLITLVAVLFILAVYRQLDRNNRSLEKLRRYSEKVKAELDRHVEERSTEFKNLAIELDVQQKTGREILKRIGGAKEELQGSAEEIENLSVKIGQYDTAITNLLSLTSRIDVNMERLQKESSFVDSTGKRLKELKLQLSELEAKIPTLSESWVLQSTSEFEKFRREAMDRVESRAAELGDEYRTLSEGLDEYRGRIDGIEVQWKEESASLLGRIERSSSEILANASEESKRLEGVITGEFESTLERRGAIDRTLLAEHEGRLKERLSHSIESFTGELQQRTTALQDEFSKRIEVVSEKIDGQAGNLDRRITELVDRLGNAQTGATDHLQVLEGRIADHEEEMGYKISRIEQIGTEIESVDGSLRSAIEDMAGRVRVEIASAQKEVLASVEEEHQKILQRVSDAKEQVSTVEKGVEGLKSRAYDNVSEKLQVFEDDFFETLRKRSEDLEVKLSEWQIGVARNMEELKEEHLIHRERLAKDLEEELKAKLGHLQGTTLQLYDRFEEQVGNYQERINGRIESSEQSLVGIEETLKREVQELRQNSKSEFEKEFVEHRTALRGEMKGWEREIEVSFKAQQEKIDHSLGELSESVKATNSSMSLWHNDLEHQTKQLSTEITDRYTQLKREVDATVDEINKEFMEQRNNLDTFHIDFQKRNKDLEMSIEQRVKEFRTISAGVKERVDSMQRRFFDKIEERYSRLDINIQEIEKQQKNFISQTRIFDRADSMKLLLQESIEDLKEEAARVTAQCKEVREAERKFTTIRKLNDEISSRISRFMTERKRIDDMEGDFKKLINLSQSMDIKLDQVTSSHDTLQEIQMRIRTLEEMGSEIEHKYERMEKKGVVLDSTMDGVDKSLERLREMESRIKEAEGSVHSLVPQLEEADRQVKTIVREREKTADAIDKLNGLAQVLKDVEERMERMDKAREWLANVETRLAQVNQEAQEQVRLLGSLVKDGAIAQKGEGSSLGARDVVVRLARQGWKVEEIARTTKLSRGEVELILELRK